jgi:hypothetical protein
LTFPGTSPSNQNTGAVQQLDAQTGGNGMDSPRKYPASIYGRLLGMDVWPWILSAKIQLKNLLKVVFEVKMIKFTASNRTVQFLKDGSFCRKRALISTREFHLNKLMKSKIKKMDIAVMNPLNFKYFSNFFKNC